MSFNIVFPMSSNYMINGFMSQSSVLLGIIPALILMYYSLKGWHEKFVEKTLFIMFIIGIISGFLVAIVQSQIAVSLELLILYPFLEQIIKVVVLNLRRFHDKQSTVIYGLALGLGFGSIYPPASMILIPEGFTTIQLIIILLGSIGLVFTHGATGAFIGYGVYKGKMPWYYFISVLILIVANLLRDPTYHWINLIIGICLYIYLQKTIMKEMLSSMKKRSRSSTKN